MSAQNWTISDLASEFDITPRTIRFYEDQGIVSPGRMGMQRVYSARDRTRLMLALRGKRLGLQLAQIRELIDMYESPTDTVPQLRHYLSVLATQREALVAQRRDIDETLAEIEAQNARCEVLLRQHTL
ncbi:MAG: MerR family DNA-binding transcriptional regulator [Burkholderiaceae bacterium]|nr:MerR family DNA-binding transcriptional regulator [Burkholderiaceae bacterium]